MKMFLKWTIPALLAVSAFGQDRVATINCDWIDEVRHRPVPARIYDPPTGDGPVPVIIFSHGLGGTRNGYEYLGRHWAGHGYVSVHIQHEGSDDAVWRGSRQPFKAMQRAAFDPANAINRPKDVSFAIDQMERINREAGPLQGRLDLDHIGVAGHSFGAYTTLASVGQSISRSRTLADPRIRAAIPMSAPVPDRPGVKLDNVYRQINVPVFHMTGTHDDSPIGNTSPKQRRLPFDHGAGRPCYLLILKDADHMAFADHGAANYHELICAGSTAFWDAYLKDDAPARVWLAEGGFKDALGDYGTLEVKNP